MIKSTVEIHYRLLFGFFYDEDCPAGRRMEKVKEVAEMLR